MKRAETYLNSGPHGRLPHLHSANGSASRSMQNNVFKCHTRCSQNQVVTFKIAHYLHQYNAVAPFPPKAGHCKAPRERRDCGITRLNGEFAEITCWVVPVMQNRLNCRKMNMPVL